MFFIAIITMLVTEGWVFLIAATIAALMVWVFSSNARDEIDAIVRHVNYVNLGLAESSMKQPITELVARMISGVAVTIFLIAVIWQFVWVGSFVVLLGYFIYCVILLRTAAIELEMSPHPFDKKHQDRNLRRKTDLPRISKRDLERAVLLKKSDRSSHFRHRSRVLRRKLEKDR